MDRRLLEAERKAAELERRLEQLMREAERTGQGSRLVGGFAALSGTTNSVFSPPLGSTSTPVNWWTWGRVLGCNAATASGVDVRLYNTSAGWETTVTSGGDGTFLAQVPSTGNRAEIAAAGGYALLDASISASSTIPAAYTYSLQRLAASGYTCFTSCTAPQPLAQLLTTSDGKTVTLSSAGAGTTYHDVTGWQMQPNSPANGYYKSTSGVALTDVPLLWGLVRSAVNGHPRLQCTVRTRFNGSSHFVPALDSGTPVAHSDLDQYASTLAGNTTITSYSCSPFDGTFDFAGTFLDTYYGITSVTVEA
jgi:hypothetical protein